MSTKVEATKILNIDNSPVAVEDLSDNVKGLVEIYDVFRSDEIEAKYELIKVQSALKSIQSDIMVTIKKEAEELDKSVDEGVTVDS